MWKNRSRVRVCTVGDMAQDTGLQRQVTELQGTVSSQQAVKSQLQAALTLPGKDDNPPSLLWRACPSLLSGVVRPHLVTLGNEVYVGGGNTKSPEMGRRVHKYVRGGEKWESLPITPHLTFALSAVNGHVTVVGGVNIVSSLTCGDLLHFDPEARKWKRTYPAMPTKRCATSATSTREHVIVAGGIHENGQSYLNTVEVLTTSTLQWSTAAPLPKPTSFMCMTACDKTDRIYMCGGLTKQGSIRSVFSCVAADLLRSSRETRTNTDDVWEEIAKTPHHRMGCIALDGKLVVASGLSAEDRVTQSVHVLDPVSRKWSEIGKMAASRSSCSLVSLGKGKMMVVGGYVNPLNWMTSLTTDVMECVNLQID